MLSPCLRWSSRVVDFHSVRGSAHFYFTRHGESEGNRVGIMQGRSASPLTDMGREQAREAGAWFASRGIQVILCSPLERAAETARIIARETGVTDLRYFPELSEIDTGVFSNLTMEEARAKLPDAWDGFSRLSWQGVPGAEKIAGLVPRAEAAWGRVLACYGEGKSAILSVTHSGFLQWIIRVTLGVDSSWMPLISTSLNCGISLLRANNTDERSYFASWTLLNAPPR